MAEFSEHINQAKANLRFLETIIGSPEFWDWKVTVSFYVGVHLINSHIAKKANLHYRSHDKVDHSINPFNEMSPTKLNENEYLSYTKLLGLSRRARYLIHEKDSTKNANTCFTYEKHLIKALKNLDILLQFISNEYEIDFNPIIVNSPYYNQKTMKYFSPQ